MGVPRIISTYATESHLSGAIFDIFCRARTAPNMAPKATVIAERAKVYESPSIKNLSQYFTAICIMLRPIT